MTQISFKRAKKAPCGVCHCKEHEGYLTVSQMKKHECIEKQCWYFQKLEHSYWVQLERRKLEKRAFKMLQRKCENSRKDQIWDAIKALDLNDLRTYVSCEYNEK